MMLTKMLLLALVFALLMAGCSDGQPPEDPENQDPDLSENANIDPYYAHFEAYPVEGFPLDQVPLFESLAVDLSLFSVQDYKDSAWAVVYGDLRNYYHVVYYTKAPTSEVLEFYSSLMDPVDEEYTFGEQLQGWIGEYKVFVNTSEGERDNTIYVSVDLPADRLSAENHFFVDCPQGLVEVEPVFEATEWTYRIDSNDDGRITYAFLYTMPVVETEFYEYYTERYEDKEDFKINDYGTISWKDQGYGIALTYDKEFKRTFIGIWKGLND